jgi:Arc/MetJ family transcription regulator
MSRTNIDFDDDLLAETMRETGQSTKKGAVEEAMRHYVKVKRQLRALESLKGLGWEGNLDEMRRDREFDEQGNRIDVE